MDKPITFVEQTIPTLTMQYFTPSQSHDSLLSSSQSDQGLYLTTESAESISTTSYYTGIDRDSEDSEKGNCNTGSEISENELIEQNREELQEADMTLEINKLNSAEDYHKELPCLKIIIDDFDKQKFNGDINSNLVVKDDSSDNKTCKWHEVSEKELNAYEGSNITPPPSTWLNPLEEPATSTLEHSHIDQTTDTPNSREPPDRCAEPDQSLSGNDLEKLKLLATRLKLQTRRGSYTMWRDKLSQAVSSPTSRQPSTRHTSDSHDTQSSIHTSDSLSTSNRLQEKLQFLRDELVCYSICVTFLFALCCNYQLGLFSCRSLWLPCYRGWFILCNKGQRSIHRLTRLNLVGFMALNF